MKKNNSRTKEFLILESLIVNNRTNAKMYLKNVHENFVIPYVNYLNEIFKHINESQLTSQQVKQLFQTISQTSQSTGGNETAFGKLLPNSIKQKFADNLPGPADGKVSNFENQATITIEQVKDPNTKKSLQNLVKQGIQNPLSQKLIIAGIQGIAGVTAGALTGGLGGVLGATAAGAISGSLIGIVTAKLQGQDWKTAGMSGLKGAAIGGAGGLLGGAVSNAVQGSSPEVSTVDSSQPTATIGANSQDLEPELLKTALSKMMSGEPLSDEDVAVLTLNDYEIDDSLKSGNQFPDVLSAGTHEADVKAALEYINADAAEKQEIRNITGLTDTQLSQIAADANKNVARPNGSNESIDRDLTIRMWALNESVGKLRGGVQLTEAGIADVIKNVKSWAMSKGQDLTQKVTTNKLMQAWANAGSPTDSNQVYKFLTSYGISANILDGVFQTMKIPTPPVLSDPVLGKSSKIDPKFDIKPPVAAAPAAAPTAKPTNVAGKTTVNPNVFNDPKKLLSGFIKYINNNEISPDVQREISNALNTLKSPTPAAGKTAALGTPAAGKTAALGTPAAGKTAALGTIPQVGLNKTSATQSLSTPNTLASPATTSNLPITSVNPTSTTTTGGTLTKTTTGVKHVSSPSNPNRYATAKPVK